MVSGGFDSPPGSSTQREVDTSPHKDTDMHPKLIEVRQVALDMIRDEYDNAKNGGKDMTVASIDRFMELVNLMASIKEDSDVSDTIMSILNWMSRR